MKFWIARDKDGTLVFWYNKPVKQGDRWYNNCVNIVLESPNSPPFGEVSSFPEVTFENSPQMIEIKLIKDE